MTERVPLFADVKVGDEVAVCISTISGSRYAIAQVTKVTPTTFVVDSGYGRFRKDGREAGSRGATWNIPNDALVVTDEIRAIIAEQRLAARRRDLRRHIMSTIPNYDNGNVLEQIVKLLQESEATK